MVLAESDCFVVAVRMLQLREHVFVSQRDAERVNVRIAAGHVEERSHLLHVVGNDEGMRLARRLEGIIACGRDPVMFEVSPPSAQRKRMHGSGMAMAR